MKQKFTAFLLIAAAVFTFTSCLGDDDDNKKDYSSYYSRLTGSYSGNMYAMHYNETQGTDTLIHKTTATVTSDSLITFTGIPLNFLVKELSDAQLREAIEAKGNTTLKVKFSIVNQSDEYISTYLAPLSVTINDVNYNNGSHKVTIAFLYPSQGYFYSSQYIHVPMFIGGIYVDDYLKEDFTNTKSNAERVLQFQGNSTK